LAAAVDHEDANMKIRGKLLAISTLSAILIALGSAQAQQSGSTEKLLRDILKEVVGTTLDTARDEVRHRTGIDPTKRGHGKKWRKRDKIARNERGEGGERWKSDQGEIAGQKAEAEQEAEAHARETEELRMRLEEAERQIKLAEAERQAAEERARRLAENQAQQQVSVPVKTLDRPKLNARNFALVIGNEKYQNLPDLGTAVADATAVAAVLKNRYAFQDANVKLLLNADRRTMYRALGE
jgi:hypothetical protein